MDLTDLPYRSLAGLLHDRATTLADQVGYGFRPLRETRWATLTYGALGRQVVGLADWLRAHADPGDRVVLAYPAGLPFVAAFFACSWVGVVAVPVAVPGRRRGLDRVQAIAADCGARLVLTEQSVVDALGADAGGLTWRATDAVPPADALGPVPDISGESLALLQYTSGSTGDPKGVMVRHRNLAHNARMIDAGFQNGLDTVVVSWLPHHHDMGLVGCVIQPMVQRVPVYAMPPAAFLQRPVRWLQAITELGGTTGGGPNFAYELCVKKVTDAQLAELDLSRWAVAFVGAEPVRPRALRRFADRFAAAGFREGAIHPCYGLAESTLCATNTDRMVPPTLLPGPDGTPYVSMGTGRYQEIRVVDPATRQPCGDGVEGEIWVRGGSVAAGYWGREARSAATFGAALASGHGPFLRTGDLGALRDGALLVTGRLTDLVILRGRNHHPHEIEHTASRAADGLVRDGAAAFTVEHDGEDRLVVVQEVERTALRRLDAPAVTMAVRRAVADAHALGVFRLVLVGPHRIPRTTSGKIRRAACRDAFLADGLPSAVATTAAGT